MSIIKYDFTCISSVLFYSFERQMGALAASDFIECNRIMGIHFDTMPVIEIDHEGAINKFKQRNKELILLQAGEVLEF